MQWSIAPSESVDVIIRLRAPVLHTQADASSGTFIGRQERETHTLSLHCVNKQATSGNRSDGASSSSLDYTAPLPVLEDVPLPSRHGDAVLQAPDACVRGTVCVMCDLMDMDVCLCVYVGVIEGKEAVVADS